MYKPATIVLLTFVLLSTSCKKQAAKNEKQITFNENTAKQKGKTGDGVLSSRIDVGVQHNTNTCDHLGAIYYDKYIIYNNTWGNYNPGYQWNCIWSAADYGWWAFGTSAGHNESTGAVKSYPAAIRGWHFGLWSNNSGMPKAMWNIKGCNISWNMEVPDAGRYNTILDIYFNRSENVGNNKSNISCNIMMLLNERNFYYNGYWDGWQERAWIGGHEWYVIKKSITESGNTFNWIILDKVNKTTNLSNFDLKSAFVYCANKGYLGWNDYLCSIQSGWEIIDGGGGAAFKSNSLNTNLW